MARAKATNSKKRAARVVGGSSGAKIAFVLGEVLGRLLRPLLPLLVLGLLYAGAAYLLWLPIRNDGLARLSRDQIMTPATITPGRMGDWLPEPELRRIRELGLCASGRSVFEPGLAEELAEAYAKSPWVKRPGIIQLGYPASIHVGEIDFRRPYATLHTQDRVLLLDREGYVLPSLSKPALDRHPWISGMVTGRPQIGALLDDAKVQSGLALLATVSEVLARASSERKVAGAYGEGVIWKVVLDNRAIIQWGFWDENLRPEGELSTLDKKEVLARRLKETNPTPQMVIKLDCPEAPIEINEIN